MISGAWGLIFPAVCVGRIEGYRHVRHGRTSDNMRSDVSPTPLGRGQHMCGCIFRFAVDTTLLPVVL